MNEIIQQTEFGFAFTCLDGRLIPNPDITFEQWKYSHAELLRMKKYLKSYIQQSQDFAVEKFGLEETATAVCQIEADLGIEEKEPRIGLNPADKSSAIVTIEGISQSFAMWHRKMHDDIEAWDRERCQKALALIEPIARLASELRSKLGQGEGG